MNRIMLSTVCQAETCPLPTFGPSNRRPPSRRTDHYARWLANGSVAVRDHPLNEVASAGLHTEFEGDRAPP